MTTTEKSPVPTFTWSPTTAAERLLLKLAKAGHVPTDKALDDEFGNPIPLDAEDRWLLDELERRYAPPRWVRPGENGHLLDDIAGWEEHAAELREEEGRLRADLRSEELRADDEVRRRADAEARCGELENEIAALRDQLREAS